MSSYTAQLTLFVLLALSVASVSRAEDTAQQKAEKEAKPSTSVVRSTKSTVLELRNDGLILISNPTATNFRLNEVVCIRATKRPLVCAYVVQVLQNGVLVAPPQKRTKVLSAGDTVLLIPRKLSADSSPTILTVSGVRHPDSPGLNALSVGINMGTPVARFEQSVSEAFTVGLTLGMFGARSPGSSVTGSTGLLTVSYYPFALYRSWWLSLGAGMYTLSVDGPGGETGSSFFLTPWATVGYRLLSRSDYFLSLGAGAQILMGPQMLSLPQPVSTLVPWVLAEVGFIL